MAEITLEAIKELLAEQKREIMSEVTVLMESLYTPRFDLLAEGQQAILEKLVPRSRVDDLEDEVRFMKAMMKQMSDEIQQLKKAQ